MSHIDRCIALRIFVLVRRGAMLHALRLTIEKVQLCSALLLTSSGVGTCVASLFDGTSTGWVELPVAVLYRIVIRARRYVPAACQLRGDITISWFD